MSNNGSKDIKSPNEILVEWRVLSFAGGNFRITGFANKGDSLVALYESKAQRYAIYPKSTYDKALNKYFPDDSLETKDKLDQMNEYESIRRRSIKMTVDDNNCVRVGADVGHNRKYGNRIVVYRCRIVSGTRSYFRTYFCSPEVFKERYPNLAVEVDTAIAKLDSTSRKRAGR